jgi:hypothetical protein
MEIAGGSGGKRNCLFLLLTLPQELTGTATGL